jgi:hypothetical protein
MRGPSGTSWYSFTPTILDQRYGTGLEDQVTGIHHSGEEFADPNGWRKQRQRRGSIGSDTSKAGSGRLRKAGNTSGAGNDQRSSVQTSAKDRRY